MVRCGRWLVVGGYQGVEGDEGTSSVGDVELLSLEDESMFNNESSWCQANLSSSSFALDGATIDMINVFSFVAGHADDPAFSSPHSSSVFERALVCGGADEQYAITNKCR